MIICGHTVHHQELCTVLKKKLHTIATNHVTEQKCDCYQSINNVTNQLVTDNANHTIC